MQDIFFQDKLQNNKFEKSVKIAAYVGIFLFSCLLYANTFNHGWVLDDGFLFKENKYVTSGLAGYKDILLDHSQAGANFLPETFQYRPVSQLFFALEWEILPDCPTFYHIMNVLWNAIASVLLYYLLRRLLKNKSWLYSLFITLIFTANPMHTEVVANIKSRDELCYFVFLILAIISALNYYEKRKLLDLLWLFLSFTLAFFSKESAVTALVAIPLIIFFFGEEKNIKNSANKTITKTILPNNNINKVKLTKNKKVDTKVQTARKNDKKSNEIWSKLKPFVAIIAIIGVSIALYLGVRYYVLHVVHDYHDSYVSLMQNFLADQALDIRWATAICLMGLYLFLAFVPYQQSCDYSFAHFPYLDFTDWQVLLVFAAYLVMLAFTIYSIFVKKQKSIFAFAFLFWVVTMSIYSNTIYLIGSSFADRFLFVPVLSTAIVFVEGMSLLVSKIFKGKLLISKITLASIVLLVVCLFSVKTVVRSADWKDGETLFFTDVEKVPNSARAKYYVGDSQRNTALGFEHTDTAAFRKGMLEAIETYQKAYKINSKYSDCCERIGFCYLRLDYYYPDRNYIDTAIYYLDKSIELFPYDALAYYNRAEASYVSGDYRTAISYYNEVLDFNEKDYIDSYYKLANSYYEEKVYDTAMLFYISEIEYEKKHHDSITKPDMFYSLGYCYSQLANYEVYTKQDQQQCLLEAVRWLDTALVRKVNIYSAYSDKLKALTALGKWQEVIKCGDEVIETFEGKHEDGYFYSAVALIQLNRIDEAIERIYKVLDLNPQNFTAYYNLAYAYSLQGKMQLAEKMQSKGVEFEKMRNSISQ